MAKPFPEIVEELDELLRKSGEPVITMTWPDFYKLSDRERLKNAALDAIREDASGRYQLVIGYGRNAVIISHDRNFQPA